ncbi:unnamed protein product [Leptosia nina]|uniref:Uncharacterized protein n=1 Tax=Leptosia nina TaxID=320188 RepID=A0AAV1JET2_9NEOP
MTSGWAVRVVFGVRYASEVSEWGGEVEVGGVCERPLDHELGEASRVLAARSGDVQRGPRPRGSLYAHTIWSLEGVWGLEGGRK